MKRNESREATDTAHYALSPPHASHLVPLRGIQVFTGVGRGGEGMHKFRMFGVIFVFVEEPSAK